MKVSLFLFCRFQAWILIGVLGAACPAWSQAYRVEEAPEWSNFFDTEHGWTGADGIFALPLDGIDRPGGLRRTDTLFLFSDTFIGDVNAQGERVNASLVNNTLGLLRQDDFLSGARFLWGRSSSGPQAVVVPDTPLSEPNDWYWFADGIVLGDNIHVLAQRMRVLPGGGAFGFARSGMAMISFPKIGPYVSSSIQQVDAPLGFPENAGLGGAFFGAGIFANTVSAGAPHPDGWIYIYGSREDPLVKKLLVARVAPQDFTDFDAWRYWNGHSWVPNVRRSIAVTGRISNELSVTPTPDGRYALIFSLDTLSNQVAMKISDNPWGPWSTSEVLWEIALPPGVSNVFTYNAKAHPHLSEPGELLISWNVNTLNFWDHFRYADIYRPRFIKLIWQ